MGVDLADLIQKKTISLDDLVGKTIAVDAYNAIYQFLTIIRGKSGEPLMDGQGRVTSHLSGLFYRITNLSEKGIRLAYVFDGDPPSLKEAEIKRRSKLKDEAQTKYEIALERGDQEEARTQAVAASRMKDFMVEDSRQLLDSLGVPWIDAPSEGEAQAAHMASRGDVWAASSQDYDALLFGAPRLVRNLSISGRRKLPRRSAYVEVEPEIVELSQVIQALAINQEQLIDLGIMVGTDYNPDGIKGVGPKTALKIIKERKSLNDLDQTTRASLPTNLHEIRELFLNPKVTSNYNLEWREPDIDATIQFLCRERDFSEERVRNALERMIAGLKETGKKTTLESFFR